MWWHLCIPGNAISLQSALGSEGRHGGCYSSKHFGSSCFRIQQRLSHFFFTPWFLWGFCFVLFCLPLSCVLLFFRPALLKTQRMSLFSTLGLGKTQRIWLRAQALRTELLLLSHFSRVRLGVTPQTAAHQAPPSLGFSRQEHWSGLPFPSPMHESEMWKTSHSVVSDS